MKNPANTVIISLAICIVILISTLLLFIQASGSKEKVETNSFSFSSLKGVKQMVSLQVASLNEKRRMAIGSMAPICTYNECRGCKTKCKAKAVPVDANDPINSPYNYKCVCYDI
eukprot:Gb_17672 [translate_table: standard]